MNILLMQRIVSFILVVSQGRYFHVGELTMTMLKRPQEEESDNNATKKLKTRLTYPCILGKDKVTGKFIFPAITKDDVMNARLFLKDNDLKTFLEYFLPVEVNSIYIYFMIKLLGFDVKDKELFMALNSNITSNKERSSAELSSIHAKAEDEDGLTDPLEKKHAVKLIKDLQKAINKVLSTRLRLPNFNTIDHFTATLRNAKKILVLTGAGVSTSLGIPDFRSSEGFYSKIRHLGLEDPQDVFNLDIFLQDPSVFYNIAHMVLPPENMYSPLHSFIKMLQDKGKLLRNYTQNIDNLESYAGIDPDKLVQCHGSFATASCVTCHWQIPGEKIFENIRNLELPLCPYCYQKRKQYFPMSNGNNTVQTNINFNSPILKSYGVLKPDMTFFGEALPSRFHKTIRKDILECDLLICIGTSLKVAPVSEIVNMVPSHVPQILINRDMVTHAEFDLNLLGFCDDVASLVAKKCHWDIPHKKWQDLKKIDYNCTEIDKGTYKIKKQPRKKQQ
ncbi:AFH_G0048870.mRNA.1.CDS.1 [Saccharomyces cerevisiae]|nr:Hst1p [Saccharomyces cerevisiae YJM1389]AJU14392.1 Hst1p [Saccharomyces cerevisiae YJM1592]CAI4751325.1 CLN_G0048720.mRNA.1.CDS.1 [Saccharomyces cerevisiae]CAI4791142.1 CEL_1a_G0048580.mRNA.1.CDS.1 [Saccharomyces cerevisiae]CAI4900406.1 AFH_G0048870.mRNA.1.CDS.1 [Saccharomyces cerevisiae]